MQVTYQRHADAGTRHEVIMLVALFGILWMFGGASRIDVLGQTIARFFAVLFLVFFVASRTPVNWKVIRPGLIVLAASVTLLLVQLLPLPPEIWLSLPGRAAFAEAAEIADSPQPWRPISVSPAGTWNSLWSLLVPATIFVLASNLNEAQHWRIASLIILMALAGSVLALAQFAGINVYIPFINHLDGGVSGNFANRNHFALFLAIAFACTLTWGFRDTPSGKWRSIAAISVLPFFVLVVLATGSRAGIILLVSAFLLSALLVRRSFRKSMGAYSARIRFALASGLIGVLAGIVLLSVYFGRAASVERALELTAIDDLRSDIAPVALGLAYDFFPVGSGFGTFDPIFRIAEPDGMLSLFYVNLAHNDWIQVVIEGGLIGGVILACSVAWVLRASFRAWRTDTSHAMLARLGAIIIFLVMFASIPDYPARTPLMMGVLAISVVWLNLGAKSVRRDGDSSPLPSRGETL